MGKIKTIELTSEQQATLEKGYREGHSHAFRLRCHMILLKSQQRSSAQIAHMLGCCEVVVNTWLQRYQAQGLQGLHTKSGRGRKAILNAETDLAQVQAAVQSNRQRISLAKAELEQALGKNFSQKTLERFVKNMVLAINESENVPPKSHVRPFIS
jgi:transposase